MNNALAQKFTFSKLILFALPNMIMMMFLSLYTIADGIFVSRFIGTTALSAVNMVYPATCLQMAVAIMFASGGSAVIAAKLGEGKEIQAKQNFSLIVMIESLSGFIVAIIGNLFTEKIIYILGTSEL